jgi:hypothetical protein
MNLYSFLRSAINDLTRSKHIEMMSFSLPVFEPAASTLNPSTRVG